MIRRVVTISSSRRKGCGVKSNSCNFLFFLLYPHVLCCVYDALYVKNMLFLIKNLLDVEKTSIFAQTNKMHRYG